MFHDTAEIDVEAFSNVNAAEQDAKLAVKFDFRVRKDEEESTKACRPVFHEVLYVTIIAPGVSEEVCRPARAHDIARFPRHYDAFKRRVELPESGTPLAEWPEITRTMAKELEHFNIKTVEHLAGANDNAATAIMGFNGIKERAGKWLLTSKDAASKAALQAELDKSRDDIAALRDEVAVMRADMEAATTPANPLAGMKAVNKAAKKEAKK